MKNIMRVKKHIYVSLIIVACFVFTGKLTAQNSPARDLNFAVSADMINFFSEGYPSKVLFKLYSFNEQGLIKGAWRIGIDARYETKKIEVQTIEESFHLTDRDDDYSIAFSLGHEWQKQTRFLNYYFGIDFETNLTIYSNNIGAGGDFNYNDKYFHISLIPFIGFEYYLSNRLSTSVELGLVSRYHFDEYYGSHTNPDNKVRQQNFTTKFQIPYTMSLNYYF